MSTGKRWRIAGINFDHMHMGDLLRQVHEHPDAEIVGVCNANPARMQEACSNFDISSELQFTEVEHCLEACKPDLVILCPATAEHAEYVERVAPYGVHILVEKPFAASLAEADRMVAAMPGDRELIINWPLRWYPSHIRAKALIDEGCIGRVLQVHYYDGNRGPLRHGADKIEKESGTKAESWFYQKSRGGGSLLDYLGYGTTLATWFLDGAEPLEVTAVVDEPEGLEVDEHSITVARYATGLSKFETRWGTFTDPWILQPQPKCGFVIVGESGTISSYDFESTVRVQTLDCPEGKEVSAPIPPPTHRGPIAYTVHCLENGLPIDGPLSPTMCRIGQKLVDAAVMSAREKRSVAWNEVEPKS